MLVKEMHIAVKEGIRNSPRKIELDSDRIDFHLNYVQKDYIRKRVRPKLSRQGYIEGFEVNQENLGDLRTIIVKNFPVNVYEAETTDLFYDDNLFYTFSMPDQMYLIGIKASSFYQTDCSALTYTPTAKSLYAKVIPFQMPPEGSSNMYTNLTFSVTIAGLTLTDYTETDPQVLSREDRFLLVKNIIEHYRNQGVLIYWEDFASYYKPSSFILPGTVEPAVTFSYDYDDTQDPPQTQTYTSTVVDLFTGGAKNVKQAIPAGTHTSVNNPARIIESEWLHKVLKENEYTGSIKESPVGTLFSRYIGMYTDGTFAVEKLYVDYIVEPRNISLKYDRSCQLPSHTHEDIVDLAVKNILRSSESSFEKQVADIQMNN